jgi:hypothetical protein
MTKSSGMIDLTSFAKSLLAAATFFNKICEKFTFKKNDETEYQCKENGQANADGRQNKVT